MAEDNPTGTHGTEESVESNPDDSVASNLDGDVHSVAAGQGKTGLYTLCGVMVVAAVIALALQLLANKDAPEATRVVTVDEAYEAPTRTLKMPKAATVTPLREPLPELPAAKVTHPAPTPTEVTPVVFKQTEPFPNTPPAGFWARDAEAQIK